MSKDFTLDDYVNNIQETFQYWLDLHTDPKTWADEWALDDVQWAFKESPVISNNYFTFNWKQAAIKAYAKNNTNAYNKCVNCGTIYDVLWDDDECCDNVQRDEEPTEEELTQWLEDMEIDGLEFSDNDLMNALIDDGFPVYQDAMMGIIDSVVNEAKEVLQAFESAGSKDEVFSVIAWANHVCHVNGEIMRDYSRDGRIDYDVINQISQDGLESVFSAEEIQGFLAEEIHG